MWALGRLAWAPARGLLLGRRQRGAQRGAVAYCAAAGSSRLSGRAHPLAGCGVAAPDAGVSSIALAPLWRCGMFAHTAHIHSQQWQP